MRGRTGRCLAEIESVGAPSRLHEDQFGLGQSLRTSAVPLKLLDMQRVPFLINLPKVERGLMSKPRFCTLAERNLKPHRHFRADGSAAIDDFRQGFAGYVEVEIFSERWWREPIDHVLATCIERHRTCV